MDSVKHQQYSNGELYAKMQEVQVRIQMLEVKQEQSYAGNIVLTLFAISLTILGLSFVVVEEARLIYILASIVFCALAVMVGRNYKTRHTAKLTELPDWARELLEGDD